jgi:hypothetical protein
MSWYHNTTGCPTSRLLSSAIDYCFVEKTNVTDDTCKYSIQKLWTWFFRVFYKMAQSGCSVCYVCLSVCMEQLSSHWTDLIKIWYVNIFWKFVKKLLVSLISDKNKGTLHEDQYTFMAVYLTQFFLEWIMFQAEVVEKIKAHILCSITFFDSHAICEITWKNTV